MGRQVVLGAGTGAALMAIVMTATAPQISQFEGTKTVPYRDIRGVLTVCNGHTGPDVVVNKVYSLKECQSLTEKDMEKAADGVLAVSPQLKYHPMQLAAAVSFSYNVGIGTYAKSSVATNFNAGNFEAGCSALLKYTYSGGVYSKGLDVRRHAEYDICTSTLTPKGLTNVAESSSTTK